MVQVDAFWSYGIGAGFALAAAQQLCDRAPGPGPASSRWTRFANPYLCGTLLYLSLLFVPSGIWLLWQFPRWETMHADIALPAWLAAGFALTNVALGALGFETTRRLLVRNRLGVACTQLLVPYYALFLVLVHGWDGTGYRRFLSATPSDLRHFDEQPLTRHVLDWLTSDVAVTLGAMGVVLIPILLAMGVHWHTLGARGRGVTSPWPGVTLVGLGLAAVLVLCPGVAIVSSVLVHALGWAAGAAVVASVTAALILAVRPLFAALVPPLILRPEAPAAPGQEP